MVSKQVSVARNSVRTHFWFHRLRREHRNIVDLPFKYSETIDLDKNMSFPTMTNQNLQLSGSPNQTGPDCLQIQPLDLLSSRINKYQFSQFWFEGCFSKVAKCRDTKTKEFLAIKIFKKRAIECQEPNRELAMLKKISGLDPANIVRFFDDFEHEGYTCLVFEMLDMNLHMLLKERRCKPLSLQEIKPVAEQLLSALNALETAGIIHTNIKPSNIVLVNRRVQPFRVKLIDFGSAITATEVEHSSITQPVGYRSPDVILGLPISEAIDMWSLGAILATMYLGSPLFPQRCQYYLIKSIMKILGQPEDDVLSEGTNTHLYFNSTQVDSSTRTWTLKMPEEYRAGTGFPPQRSQSTQFNNLYDLVVLCPDVETREDKMKFVSLLGMMLHLNPQKRTTPSDALTHLFSSNSKPDSDAAGFYDIVPDTLSVSPTVESAGGDKTTTNIDSAASCQSGDENVPAFNDETPDCAAVLAPAAADDASVASAMTCRNDTVSAAEDASESTARLTDGTAEQDLTESLREASDETALTPASTTPIMTVRTHDPDSADEGRVITFSAAKMNTESLEAEKAAVASGSADQASVESEISDTLPADKCPANNTTGGEVTCDAARTTHARTRPLKRIRKWFGRMFRSLCCCCCCCCKAT